MQKKLQRLDEIVRNSYADGRIAYNNYIEATELLVKLSNELKLLNIGCVNNSLSDLDGKTVSVKFNKYKPKIVLDIDLANDC